MESFPYTAIPVRVLKLRLCSRSRDLMPTMLQAAGLPVPERVQGRSRLAEVRNRDLGWKEPVFLENITQKPVDGKPAIERAVRTPEWNYSAIWNKEKYEGRYAPQLYDRKKDPEELQSVADQYPAVVKELQTKLERYIASGWGMTNGSFNEKAG